MLRKCFSALGLFTVCCLSVAQSPLANAVPHRYLVVYRQSASPTQLATARQRLKLPGVSSGNTLGVEAVELTDSAALQRIAADPAVESILQDRAVQASRITAQKSLPTPPGWHDPSSYTSLSDSYAASPQGWAQAQVGAYGSGYFGQTAFGPWNITMGNGIRIAILDSGVDQQHPDIAPNIALNLTEVNQKAWPSPCDDGSPQDQGGHGTFTASLAAGAYGAGTGLVTGVAPQAQILNIKVLQRMPDTTQTGLAQQCTNGQASGLLSWTIQGIQDAIDNHANIIVMSFGVMVDLTTGDGAGLKTLYDRITYAASQAGILLVAAAGNNGFDFADQHYAELPAQARGVLAVVASTNPDCQEDIRLNATCQAGPPSLTYYSNRGTQLNALAAPGGSYPLGSTSGVTGWVRGACSNGKPFTLDGLPTDALHSYGCFNLGHQQYVQIIGTSAAAPLAAGAAALLMAAHPAWSATTLLDKLRSTATPSPSMSYSVLNAAAALGIR